MENPEDILPTQNINSTNGRVSSESLPIEFHEYFKRFQNFTKDCYEKSTQEIPVASAKFCENASEYSNKFKKLTAQYYESFKVRLEDASTQSSKYFNELKKHILNDENSGNSNDQNTNNLPKQFSTSSGSDGVNKNSYMSLANDFLTNNSKNITIGGGAIAGIIILYKTVKYIIKNKKNSAVENDNSDSNIHNGK